MRVGGDDVMNDDNIHLQRQMRSTEAVPATVVHEYRSTDIPSYVQCPPEYSIDMQMPLIDTKIG